MMADDRLSEKREMAAEAEVDHQSIPILDVKYRCTITKEIVSISSPSLPHFHQIHSPDSVSVHISSAQSGQELTITPVKLIGVVCGSDKPSIVVPATVPNTGQWCYVDVPAIARAAGLPENTIYIEDINAVVDVSQPYPFPKDVNTLIRYSVMPQDHLN